MDTYPESRVRAPDSSKSLSRQYSDIVHRLSALLQDRGALANARLLDSNISRGIHMAWLNLRVWASDIDQDETNILDNVPKEFLSLTNELDSRMRTVDSALTGFEKEVEAKKYFENLGELEPLITGILDAVTLLVRLAEPVMDLNKAKAGKDMASCVDRALKKRSGQLTSLSEVEQFLSPEDAKDFSELQASLTSQPNQSAAPKEPTPRSAALQQVGTSPIFTGQLLEPTLDPDIDMLAALTMDREWIFPPIGRAETRLATIYPGKSEKDIVCSIRAVRVRDLQTYDYEAISYVWDFSESDSETVWVVEEVTNESNSKAIWIEEEVTSESVKFARRKRLHLGPRILRCLQRLRRTEKAVTIWVDVLCLDLRSTKEKRLQSVNFAEVFACARCVSFWLGEDDQIFTQTVEWVERLVLFDSPDDLDLTPASSAAWESFLCFLQHDLVSLRIHMLDSLPGDLQPNQFSRRWIVQEMILARRAIFLSGEKKLEWQSFADAINFWQTAKSKNPRLALRLYQRATMSPSRPLTLTHRSFAELVMDMRHRCVQRDKNGAIVSLKSSLEELVVTFSEMTNSEPRDAVFAYLFLAADTTYIVRSARLSNRWKSILSAVLGMVESWHLNYNYGVGTIFKEFVKHCITSSGSLDIICRPWAPESSLLLPSWMKKCQGHGTAHLSALTRFVGDPGRSGQIYRAAAHTSPVYEFWYGLDATFEYELRKAPAFVVKTFKRERMWRDIVERTTHKAVVPRSLFVDGIPLGTIAEVSPRISQGLITRECLELGGIYFPGELRKWRSEDIPPELWQTLVADRTLRGDRPPSWYPSAIARCLSESPDGDLDTKSATEENTVPAVISEVLARIREVTWNRKLFRAGEDEELLGLGPADAAAGDLVCILFGCSVPVILRERRIDSTSYFELLGESFVHGKMDGEAVDELNKADLQKKTSRFDIR